MAEHRVITLEECGWKWDDKIGWVLEDNVDEDGYCNYCGNQEDSLH